MSVKNMSLKMKLIGGFAIVAAITLIVGAVGLWSVQTLDKRLEEVGEVRLPSVQGVLGMEVGLEEVAMELRSLLIPGLSPDRRRGYYSDIAEARRQYQEAYDIYAPLPQTEEEGRIWNEFENVLPRWVELNDDILALHEEFDKIGIMNPDQLISNLQKFRGDHYALEVQVASLISAGDEFAGGEDATACNFGRWIPDFETENRDLNRLITQMKTPHNQFHQAVNDIKTAVEEGNTAEAQRIFADRMQPASHDVFDYFDQMIELANEAESIYDELNTRTMEDSYTYQKEAFSYLNDVVDINIAISEEEVEGAARDAVVATVLAILGMVIGTVVALVLGFVLALTISKALIGIISELSSGSDQVAAASEQLSSSSQTLSQGASEQASSIEEVSSSLEEVTAQSKQNSQNSQEANGLSKDVEQKSRKGAGTMEELSTAMDEIKNSSDETAKIIKNIDDIASQTNLLALNAAVEAARAGDAGKGFAVVAEEVRNLSQRAAEAAKDTANLIEESQQYAEKGVGLSKNTRESINEILETATKVSALVGEVNAASEEQTRGVEEINNNVSQLDQVTQENAANAEESASSSEELASQAESLSAIVDNLSGLIYGAGTQRTASMGSSSRRSSHGTHGASRNHSSHAAIGHGVHSGSSHQGAAKKQKTTEVNPNTVLPMDDEDFEDF
ncbi:MAG: methyl-accepting chemotaxis protein [Fibrobacterota bacterium]